MVCSLAYVLWMSSSAMMKLFIVTLLVSSTVAYWNLLVLSMSGRSSTVPSMLGPWGVRRVERRPDKVEVEATSVRMNSAEGDLQTECWLAEQWQSSFGVGMWRQWSPFVLLSFLKLTGCHRDCCSWQCMLLLFYSRSESNDVSHQVQSLGAMIG
jgi:hypothetical protein